MRSSPAQGRAVPARIVGLDLGVTVQGMRFPFMNTASRTGDGMLRRGLKAKAQRRLRGALASISRKHNRCKNAFIR
jgi:hypothetical protein